MTWHCWTVKTFYISNCSKTFLFTFANSERQKKLENARSEHLSKYTSNNEY